MSSVPDGRGVHGKLHMLTCFESIVDAAARTLSTNMEPCFHFVDG